MRATTAGRSTSTADPAPETVGPYVIEGELGRGGMGVVFRGRDRRHGREVALKRLPGELAADPAWLDRFKREAKALASLHHTNIAAIHGIERAADGTPFLVLERVEGETLATRLERGPLDAGEALDACHQVAAALEASHARGVVHRDLKPGNVMLTPWGLIKVLDFGVAQREIDAPTRVQQGGKAGGRSASATETGVWFGTPGYMSPEQVLGLALDSRSDVFAFGCLLFECLSGQAAFSGSTVEETMAAVIAWDPPLSRLPEGTPPEIRVLLEHCLERDRERRLADLGEARQAIERIRAAASGTPSRAVEDVLDTFTLPTPPPRPSAASASQSREPGHNLPLPATRFIGRDREVREILGLLGRTRHLTLTGPGGGGKTRLALRVADALRDRFPDGTWFVDLAPLTDEGRVSDAVAAAVGVGQEPGQSLIESLVRQLEPRRTLLVLDNCEHLLGACRAIAGRLLEVSRELRILATSREWLGVRGEETYPVPPLGMPEVGARDAASVAAAESVQLFVERARRSRSRLAIDSMSAGPAAQICRQLDGMPLAIELAAAQLGELSLEELGQRLSERLAAIDSQGDERPVRQRTLDAAIQWSYERLHPEEQAGLQALAIFSGGCTLEAAVAVCGMDDFSTLDLLTRLVDRSMLTVTSGRRETRYRMLEAVRQFALATGVSESEAEPIHARHAAFFSELAQAAEPELTGPDQARWLASLDADHDNLLAAIEWWRRRGDGSLATRLAAALYRLWFTRGYYETGRRVLAAVLAHDRGGPTLAQAKALWGAGNLAVFQGEPLAARPLFEAALSAYRSLGDGPGTARALNGLGLVAQDLGDYQEAGRCFEEGLETFLGLGEKRGSAAMMGNLGVLHWYHMDQSRAAPLLTEATTLARDCGAKDSLTQLLADLGLVLVRSGQTAEARARLTECLDLAHELEARRSALGAIESSAELALGAGEGQLAARWYGAAEALREAIGVPADPYELPHRAEVLGNIERALGKEARMAAWATGRALSFEAVLDEARAWFRAVASQPLG